MRKCAVKKSFSRVSQTVHNIAVLIKLSKWFETLWWIFCWYFRDFCACMMPRRITRSTRELRVINADQFFQLTNCFCFEKPPTIVEIIYSETLFQTRWKINDNTHIVYKSNSFDSRVASGKRWLVVVFPNEVFYLRDSIEIFVEIFCSETLFHTRCWK